MNTEVIVRNFQIIIKLVEVFEGNIVVNCTVIKPHYKNTKNLKDLVVSTKLSCKILEAIFELKILVVSKPIVRNILLINVDYYQGKI